MRLDDITVIVPTRNEQKNILSFLNSLPRHLPLIVVDASQDNTPDLVESHRPAQTIIIRQPGHISEARQWGAEAAKTRWLLFTDADVIFAPHYFERLANLQGYNAVFGPKLSLDEFVAYYHWFAYGQNFCYKLGLPAATGSNLLVERHAFQLVGGFDTRLSCNEDSELVWRVKRYGYSVLFDPQLVVYARDHRRLRAGLMRKTTHSVVRSALLYFNLIPARWRSRDWGYWSHTQSQAEPERPLLLKG